MSFGEFMEIGTIVRSITKMFLVVSFANLIYLKITNCNQNNLKTKVLLIIESFCLSVLNAFISVYMHSIEGFLIVSVLNGLLLALIIKESKTYFIFAYLLSILISYVFYLLSLVVAGLIAGIFIRNVEYGNIVCIGIICLVDLLIFLVFRSLKRVKKGFNFLANITKSVTYIVLLFLGLALLIYGIIPKNKGIVTQIILLSSGILVPFSLFMIIKNQITKHYRSNMRDRTISVQKEEIDANEKEISELKEQNLKLAKTIHKYNHRLSSLENSIRKVIDNSNVEFASELSIVLEQTKKVGEQLSDETKVTMKLPTTNVLSVDNMLDYMKEEAAKCGIDFALKVSDSVKTLIDKYIAEDKFETLLGDHIKDAIIAIKSKGDGYKSILVLIGIVDGAYELSIYDTGVEFDIPTLLKLGTEPITTHKNDGGSGLGFMTTFETLKSCKASLVIEEYDAAVTNYTKSVTVRFDGKCEYRIYSYRADKIKSESNNRKIIIKSI